jgi:hypothetical protein
VVYIEFDGLTGSLFDYQIAIEHKPWKHWAFGLGLETMSMKIQVQEETSWPGFDFDGTVGFGFNGLMFYVKCGFY